MEWFMSGSSKCPEKLSKWWSGQLNEYGEYLNGYSHQLRQAIYSETITKHGFFDQIKYILDGIKEHPHSRRLRTTTWNTGDMANITKSNNNTKTPSSCHGSFVQYFVVGGALHMKHWQASADCILGVPHNFVQYWALLTYFASHSNLKVGSLTWVFGDAHIYNEESHIEAAEDIIGAASDFISERWKRDSVNGDIEELKLNLVYNYSGELDAFGTPKFAAADFTIEGEIPKPTVLTKPKLL
jgi:thymidylate synthase